MTEPGSVTRANAGNDARVNYLTARSPVAVSGAGWWGVQVIMLHSPGK
jgi:hypothetical protein